MADNGMRKDHYLETDYRGSADKCNESPLPIAQSLAEIQV